MFDRMSALLKHQNRPFGALQFQHVTLPISEGQSDHLIPSAMSLSNKQVLSMPPDKAITERFIESPSICGSEGSISTQDGHDVVQ